jgi:exopolysaccharide production protein ExoQ
MGFWIFSSFFPCLLWLYYQDQRGRTSVSKSTWIVVLWAAIYSSRPVTEWFILQRTGMVVAESVDEGNPVEAFINGSLIAAGIMVLFRRNLQWGSITKCNTWLLLFYSFWLLSVFWSDYPIITIKRLFKDLGTVVMALVILSEKQPGESLRALCSRVTYLCIPLSALLIRFYPEWGRAYAGYDKSEAMWVGVATHKNTLGVLAMVGAVFILWDILESLRTKNDRHHNRILLFVRFAVLAICWHLLLIINSVTSLICAALGSLLLVVLRLPFIKGKPGRLEAVGLASLGTVVLVDSIIGLKDLFLQGMGRDSTLTTRTDIWPMLIELQDNTLVGAGFNSFWAGERLRISVEKFGGIFQAHNGYLETYLNGGYVGVVLLFVLLGSGYWRIRNEFARGFSDSNIRLVILIIAAVYNYSEASFNKIGVLWLLTILSVMSSHVAIRPTRAVSVLMKKQISYRWHADEE